MLQFRSIVGPALIMAAALVVPVVAQANTIVVTPPNTIIVPRPNTIVVVPTTQSISPISDQYLLQSQLLQHQLNQDLQRQLDQSRLRIQLDQQLNQIQMQQNIQSVNDQLQRNLFEQRLILLERTSPVPMIPAAVGGST